MDGATPSITGMVYLYVGDAFRTERKLEEAKAAYQKVIDTPKCHATYVARAKKNLALVEKAAKKVK